MKFFKRAKEMWNDPQKFIDWKYSPHTLICAIILCLLIAAFI